MNPQQQVERACFWMELKESWDEWRKSGVMPQLSTEAQQYFVELAERLIRGFVSRHPSLFYAVPPPAEGREAWSVLLEYLTRVRKITRTRLLDVIFENALRKASEKFKGNSSGPAKLEEAIGWILNQFYTRVVSEAMRDYVRQHAPPPPGIIIDSMERPLSTNGGKEKTVADSISSANEADWTDELEGKEIAVLSGTAAATAFSNTKPSARLGMALRVLRVRRCVTISCEEPAVLSVAGVAKSVIADGASDCLIILAEELELSPAIKELDPKARVYAHRLAAATLMDHAEEWLFKGSWIADFCRLGRAKVNRAGAIAPECTVFVGKAASLAEVLRERLMISGKLFSENEMAPIFTFLKKPACPC